jgi:hypothetical protein
MACARTDPDDATSPQRHHDGVGDVDEIRLRAHARPLDEPEP